MAECLFCMENKHNQHKEPLLTTPLPARPWQRIGADLCEQAGQKYLVVVDYYSRYIKIAHFTNMTSGQTIGKMKNMFAHWGIPDEVVTDNGLQFSSDEFRVFTETYGFVHTTSSPYFPQSNGEVERAMQTAKKILKQDDPFLALMAYRATPVHPTQTSPCQLIMGRQIRTRIPTLEKNLLPQWPTKIEVQHNDKRAKAHYRINYDRRHGTRRLPELQPGDQVLIKRDDEKQWRRRGVLVKQCTEPRSYLVQTSQGTIRRNRRHLQLVPTAVSKQLPVCDIPTPIDDDFEPDAATIPTDAPVSQPVPPAGAAADPYVTRSGRTVVGPARFREN